MNRFCQEHRVQKSQGLRVSSCLRVEFLKVDIIVYPIDFPGVYKRKKTIIIELIRRLLTAELLKT